MSGKIVQELDKKLFRRPLRVAQSKVNGDLYIADKTDEGTLDSGKVLAIGKDYKVRYEYTGGPDNEESFFPYGICTDEAGHVLIIDCHNDRVHILGRDGQFLQYLLIGKQGLREPYSIDVDSAGNAWVGETAGRVKVAKYIL